MVSATMCFVVNTHVLELPITNLYIPESVVATAVVPSLVVAAVVLPPTVVPCRDNRNNNCNANSIINMVCLTIHIFVSTLVVELRIILVYIPASVVGTKVVSSSVVATDVIFPKVGGPYNNNRSVDVSVSINKSTNKTDALILRIVKIYIPVTVIGAAVVSCSVIASEVVPSTFVPCNKNKIIKISNNINNTIIQNYIFYGNTLSEICLHTW